MFVELSIVVAVLCVSAVLFFRYQFSYWSRRNVPNPKPQFPFGNLQGFAKRQHLSLHLTHLYNSMRNCGPFCGIYFFQKPVVLALSMEFIKNVLIKDFGSFQDRGVYYNVADDPLSAHLIALDAAQWKPLRNKLTPTFTSGKMKFMFPTIVNVATEFQQCLTELMSGDGVLEMKELLARFTTDVIGTCAFGINCNSLKDPNAQFRAMGKKVFEKPRNGGLKINFLVAYKELARKLHIKVHHDDVTEFFLKIVRETIETRETNSTRRNDFMDLMIEIKNRGKLDGSDMDGLTLEEIAAQAFVFFLAGFETTSTALSYAMYELALNPELQTRGRREIEEVLRQHDGELTYEAMMQMNYLDNIINESLRKYPPIGSIFRVATRDYLVPDSSTIIEKGTLMMIPVYGIHHDPVYYPEPERFDPDRFSAEVSATRPNEAFLAFGDGPRNCIGLRFGMIQARIGLITLLRNFTFSICEQTTVPLEFDANSVVLTSKGGLYLQFKTI